MDVNLARPQFSLLMGLAVLIGCTFPEKQFTGKYGSRLHADLLPPGSHRLVQVGELVTRDQLREIKIGTKPVDTVYGSLIAAGIPDHEITDRSVAAAIAQCCGGKVTEDTHILFYIPPDLSVGEGDVVEVKVGESPDFGPAAQPNVAVRVRERRDFQAACKWLPDEPGLWMRVLYCDGIEHEGWKKNDDIIGWWTLPPLG